MTRTTLIFALVLAFPALAQDDSNDNEGAIIIDLADKEAWEQQQKILMEHLNRKANPLPDDFLKQQQQNREKRRAIKKSPPWNVAEYLSVVKPVALAPGEKAVTVDLAAGLPVMLTLKDSAGQPVRVLSHNAGPFLSITKPGEGVATAAEKPTDGKTVNNQSQPATASDNVLILKAEVSEGQGNALVLTDRSDVPLSLNIRIGKPGRSYIDRYVLVIPAPGNAPEELQLDQRSDLMRVISGLPPHEASQVFYGDGLRAWETPQGLWVRTPWQLVWPTHIKARASLHGVNAYLIRPSSVLNLLDEAGRVHERKKEI